MTTCWIAARYVSERGRRRKVAQGAAQLPKHRHRIYQCVGCATKSLKRVSDQLRPTGASNRLSRTWPVSCVKAVGAPLLPSHFNHLDSYVHWAGSLCSLTPVSRVTCSSTLKAVLRTLHCVTPASACGLECTVQLAGSIGVSKGVGARPIRRQQRRSLALGRACRAACEQLGARSRCSGWESR